MTTIKPARPELLAFAAASRDQDFARELDRAIAAATTAGWPPIAITAYAVRLILREDSSPRELLEACRDPLAVEMPPAPPETHTRGAALARQLLAEKAKAEPEPGSEDVPA